MGTPAAVGHTRLQDRLELERLAEEQAALRRVATLVACGASSGTVFAAVADEVAQVMRVPTVVVSRYDDEGTTATVLATSSDRPHRFHSGTRWPLDGPSAAAEVWRTGRPARVTDYGPAGSLSTAARESGLKGTVGVPIVVDGQVWGV